MPTGQNVRGKRYRSHQVPAVLGIKGREFRLRLLRGEGPVPDGWVGFAGVPFWYEDTLQDWFRKRGRYDPRKRRNVGD